jgi:hypothetical protein
MGRFERSWNLVKASAAVLRSDRELLVFPLLSAIGSLLVTATFVVPLAIGGALTRHGSPDWLWPLGFLFYLVQYFVIFFFNAALVGAARIRLDGGDPTLADGFRLAASRWTAILGYAAIAATVGLLGIAWTVATFLAVPVLVNENVGPIDAVKRSAELLKRSWGENLIGNVGLGFVFGLIVMAWALLGIGAVMLALNAGATAAAIGAGMVAVIGFLLLGLVQSALQGVYAAALHRYAQTGQSGSGFDGALIADAFRVKA